MMSQPHTALTARDDANASLGELLRARALTSSAPLLLGQLAAGVAINSALLVWFPKGWGIATAGMATVLLHSLWSLAVRRTTHASFDDSADDVQTLVAPAWWRVRRIAAVTSATSALVLMWFVCLFMLGRLMS